MRGGRFGGRRFAVSLSFDDARLSQLDVALAVLDHSGVRATFCVLPEPLRAEAARWRAVLQGGHEIGNHSSTHPRSASFAFSARNGLEEYDLEAIAADIDAASESIADVVGAPPRAFAYPCGQSFVGRGAACKSYVPVVSAGFDAGRSFNGETSNDPERLDLAHLTALDGMSVARLEVLLEEAREAGRWLVLAGHDVGPAGYQHLETAVLAWLCGQLSADVEVLAAPITEVAALL